MHNRGCLENKIVLTLNLSNKSLSRNFNKTWFNNKFQIKTTNKFNNYNNKIKIIVIITKRVYLY